MTCPESEELPPCPVAKSTIMSSVLDINCRSWDFEGSAFLCAIDVDVEVQIDVVESFGEL